MLPVQIQLALEALLRVQPFFLYLASRLLEQLQDHGQRHGWHHLEVLFPREALLQVYNQLELVEYPGAQSALYLHYVLNYALFFLNEKKHDNINRLISLPNLNRTLNFFFGRGGHLRDEYSWNQYICFTTLRLLVSCIYFKYSFSRSIEEYIYYAITIWPLYVVDIKSCHHEGGLLLLWFGLRGNNLFLRFAILIITTCNGNNCFILLQATLVKIVQYNLRHMVIYLFSNLQESVARSLVLCVCYVHRCLSFCSCFFWPLHCLYFIDFRLLITPLVSSNFGTLHCLYFFDLRPLITTPLVSSISS